MNELPDQYNSMLNSLSLNRGAPAPAKEPYDPRTLWPLNPNFAEETVPLPIPEKELIPYNKSSIPIAGAPAEAPVQSSPTVNPLDLQNQAFEQQKAAITGLEQASLGQNEATRQALNDVLMKPEDIKANNDRIKKIQDEQIAKQKELEATTVKLKGLDEEYGKMGVNNEKFWEDRGTGSKILAGISIFLGGLGGGQNNALKIIDDAIDRDIASQKANIEKAGGRITQTKGLLGELRYQLGSMQSAENAYRAIASTNVQNQLSMAAAKSADPKVKAQADMAIGQLDQAKAKFLLDAAQTAQAAMAESILSPTTTQDQMLVKLLAKTDPDKAQRFVRGPGYVGFINGDKAEVAKIKQATIDASNAMASIDKLKVMDRKIMPTDDVVAEAKILRNMLVGNLKTFIVGQGAISDSDWKLLYDTVPNPTELTTISGQTKLKVLRDTLVRGAQKAAEVYGLSVDPEYNKVIGVQPVVTKTGKK